MDNQLVSTCALQTALADNLEQDQCVSIQWIWLWGLSKHSGLAAKHEALR